MGDLTLLPDGTVFLCNGAQIGKLAFLHHTMVTCVTQLTSCLPGEWLWLCYAASVCPILFTPK